MIIDTDVLIWYLRGNPKAATAVDGAGGFAFSAVTYMELLQGARNQDELRRIREALRETGARNLHLTENVSARATSLVEKHHLSHALELADALIAATCIEAGEPLLTGNHRHFRMVKDLDVVKFTPA